MTASSEPMTFSGDRYPRGRLSLVPAIAAPAGALGLEDLVVARFHDEHPQAAEVTLRALAVAYSVDLRRSAARQAVVRACHEISRVFPAAVVSRAALVSGLWAWRHMLEEQLTARLLGQAGTGARGRSAADQDLERAAAELDHALAVLRQGTAALPADHDLAAAEPLDQYLIELRRRALQLAGMPFWLRFCRAADQHFRSGVLPALARRRSEAGVPLSLYLVQCEKESPVPLMLALIELASGYTLPAEIVGSELLQQLGRTCVRAIAYGRDLAHSPAEPAPGLVQARDHRYTLVEVVALERELRPGQAFDAALRLVNHEARTLLHLGALVSSELCPQLPCMPRHVEAILRFHRVQLESVVGGF